MWAISSIPSQASSWPPPATTTKSPRAHGPVTVSAKPQRQSPSHSLNKNINNHFKHDDDDGLAESVNTPISIFNPKQVKSEEDIDSDVRSQEEEGNDSSDEEKQLGVGVGGSDILWALQKAFAQKKQKKKREIPASNSKGGGGGGDTGKRNGKGDYYVKNVKQLCIRSDWSKRLDDLESRLGELSQIPPPPPNH